MKPYKLNKAQLKCLAVFSVFMLIGFGPVSPGCLIGMFITWQRPLWFLRLIKTMYNQPLEPLIKTAEQIKKARIKCFLSLLTLFIIDIAPVPVTPVIAFMIILSRPLWFYKVVLNMYADK